MLPGKDVAGRQVAEQSLTKQALSGGGVPRKSLACCLSSFVCACFLAEGPTSFSLENARKFWSRAKIQFLLSFSDRLTCLTQLPPYIFPISHARHITDSYRNLGTPSHLLHYKRYCCQLPSPKQWCLVQSMNCMSPELRHA